MPPAGISSYVVTTGRWRVAFFSLIDGLQSFSHFFWLYNRGPCTDNAHTAADRLATEKNL